LGVVSVDSYGETLAHLTLVGTKRPATAVREPVGCRRTGRAWSEISPWACRIEISG